MEINLKTLALAVVCSTGLLSQTYALAHTDSLPAATVDAQAAVASSDCWKRLLHYRKGLLSREQSEIDRREFFLSADGHIDPLSELKASIEAFAQPPSAQLGRYDQHPQCVYPERFRFLKSRLALTITNVECPLLRKWKAGLSAESVSLIYAAPYLGNPASMFGHTFLRLSPRRSTLADASVSFDALPTDDRGLTYAFKGLFGLYAGVFSVQPFHLKFKSYSQIESRDLWSYDLALTPVQIDRLTSHLWELGAADFDYYFIDENCSYQLLALLEVANPDWKLKESFRAVTIPLDTVRAVQTHSGSIRDTSLLESRQSLLTNRLKSLRSEERARFDVIRKNPSELREDESAAVLDALLDWHSYQTENKMDGGDSFSDDVELRMLRLRANTKEKSVDVPVHLSVQAAPHEGHLSSKVTIAAVSESGTAAARLELRSLLHDRLDADQGYLPYSALVVGRVAAIYFPKAGKVGLDDFTIAEVLNFQPMTALQRHASWLVSLKIGRPNDPRCFDCLAAAAVLGGGASVLVFSDRALLSGLLKSRFELSNSFEAQSGHVQRLSPSAEIRLLINIDDILKSEATLEQGLRIFGVSQGSHPYTHVRFAVARPWRALQSDLRAEVDVYFAHGETRTTSRFSFGTYF